MRFFKRIKKGCCPDCDKKSQSENASIKIIQLAQKLTDEDLIQIQQYIVVLTQKRLNVGPSK